MADTASLIARVKTEGVAQAGQQLDGFSAAAGKAEGAANKLPAATEKAAKGVSRVGQVAGQAGYQIQDFIVQIQGGQSALLAFSQQGGQLFGAINPLLGLFVTLGTVAGSVLYNAFSNAGKSADDLDKSAKAIASSFQQSKDGTLEFSDALVALSQNGDMAYNSTVKLLGLQADKQVEDVTKAIKAQGESLLGNSVAAQTNTETLDQLIAKGGDVANTLDSINVITDASSGVYANLRAAVGDLAQEYGLGTKEITDMLVAQREFNKEPSAENAQKYADATSRAAAAAKENKDELLDQAVALQKNANALATAEKQQDLVTQSQKRMGDATNSTTQRINEQNNAIVRGAQIAILSERDRAKAQADIDKESFAKREGVTKDQIDAYNKARDQEAAQDIARIDKTEQEKNKRIAEEQEKRELSATRKAENEAKRQRNQAETFIDGIKRQGADEIAVIAENERQKLDRLDELQKEGALKTGEYESTKTKIMLDADTARQEELAKRELDRQKKQNGADTLLAQIQAANEGELGEFQRQQQKKLELLEEYHKNGLYTEEQFQEAKDSLAKESLIKQSTYAAQQFSNVFGDLSSAMKDGSKEAKAFAVAQAVMQTYLSAVSAYQSASAIPVIGWVMGPIAAAAAVAAGLANVQKIRSAREQGGNLAAGQISTIAERGKPEVIMPAGASRVRTAEQMRQIMGEGGKNNGTPQISIINQTTGRIDSVQQEQDDEGRITLLIREVVSGDLQDSNSRITKSRRVTRGQPGFS